MADYYENHKMTPFAGMVAEAVPVDDVLNRAITLIKVGRKAEAQRLLQPYIATNPRNVNAWLWDARTRITLRSRIEVLERCLLYNPGDLQTRQALEALYTQLEKPVP